MRSVLAKRGVPHTVIDDALQETALRALQREQGFDSAEELVRWTMTVARHEVIAEWRRVSRLDFGETRERDDPEDVADRVEQRLQLEAVRKAFDQLSEAEKGAIRSGLADKHPVDAAERTRDKVRRFRARRHLDQLVEQQFR